jgi:hypothetical protein
LVKDAALTQVRNAGRVKAKELEAIAKAKLPGVVYRKVNGGPVELFHGSLVEGSIDRRGIQPHYVVDLFEPRITTFLSAARALRKSVPDFHARCDAVRALVSRSMRVKGYSADVYLGMLGRARQRRHNVTLGEYLRISAGVCREHALLAHLALREAGIHTRYLYVRAVNPEGQDVEDHAIALAFDGAEARTDDLSNAWIVDAYNPMFHGKRLPKFLRDPSSALDTGWSFRVLEYPTYWIPVRAALPPHTRIGERIDVKSLDLSNLRVVRFQTDNTRRFPLSVVPTARRR